jgi:hypothetical protein
MKNTKYLDSKTELTTANTTRRKALTGIVLSGAVASTWHKPLISAVILPAHAQTSNVSQDFFATTADANETNQNANILLEAFVPSAYALAPNYEEPLNELKFEAEAIDQGNATYEIKIAAEKVSTTEKTTLTNPANYIFGWEGTVSGLNSNANLTSTGCAQNETVRVTAVNSNALTLEMSYFTKTIELELSDGSASLPAFPLLCNS